MDYYRRKRKYRINWSRMTVTLICFAAVIGLIILLASGLPGQWIGNITGGNSPSPGANQGGLGGTTPPSTTSLTTPPIPTTPPASISPDPSTSPGDTGTESPDGTATADPNASADPSTLPDGGTSPDPSNSPSQ